MPNPHCLDCLDRSDCADSPDCADDPDDPHCPDVAAVLVTYHPDAATLQAALQALRLQVGRVYVVDNTATPGACPWLAALVQHAPVPTQLLPQAHNLGLGAAHNVGIDAARVHGARWVLLLDQDSRLEPHAVARLRSAALHLQQQGRRLAAVGLQYRAEDAAEWSGFVRFGRLHLNHYSASSARPVVEADFLISSGSLIPMHALDEIGLMDEGLFIDHVDTEWCLRARSLGYELFGVYGARMIHALGEKRWRVWLGRWRNLPLHQPFRYYYIFRNNAVLLRRTDLSPHWKRITYVRHLYLALFCALPYGPWYQRLRMIALGLHDARLQRLGRRDDLSTAALKR